MRYLSIYYGYLAILYFIFMPIVFDRIDGFRDCPSGDDESPQKCPTCHATGDFKCANNRCIMLSLRLALYHQKISFSYNSEKLCTLFSLLLFILFKMQSNERLR